MSKFAIIADATCDLSQKLQEAYKVTVVPGHLATPDKGELVCGPDWEHYAKEDFYKLLKKNPAGFSTSPANAAEFEKVFESFAAQGVPVLAMSISSGISGAHNFMRMARTQVLERYPSAKIICLDSLRFGPGFGLMVMHASQLRSEGKTLEQTAAILEEKKCCYRQAGWLDDLSFVAKKGRINHAQAFFGSLAGVKPIGEFDENGLTTVLAKAKGAKAAYAALLAYMEATIVDPENQTIIIAQSDRLKQAQEYKAMIEEKFHPKHVIISDLHPLCSVNIGPGLMGAYYVGTPISKGLVEEKKLMESILNKE